MRALILLAWPALAAAASPSPWVTVDESGTYQTITPSVTHGSTISAPPSELTQSATYALISSSHTTTATGIRPVATATGPGIAGSFLACSNYQGSYKPFCQPENGAELPPDSTYYITWDPSFFYAGAFASIEVLYGTSESSGATGFSTSSLDASDGFYAWTIESDFLAKHDASAVTATIYATYLESPHSNDSVSSIGPVVTIKKATKITSKHHVSALVIALPVVLGIALLALLGFCVWSWRRYGSVLPCCAVSRRSSQGYGVRQTYPQRTDAVIAAAAAEGGAKTWSDSPPMYAKKEPAATNIQLTDRDSWSPTTGHSNAFREELRRQEESK